MQFQQTFKWNIFVFAFAFHIVAGVRGLRACKYMYLPIDMHTYIYILWRDLWLMRSSDNYYTSRSSSNKNNTYNNNNNNNSNDHKHNNCLINLSVLWLTVATRSLQVLHFGVCIHMHICVYVCDVVDISAWLLIARKMLLATSEYFMMNEWVNDALNG